ncbi:MAG TPA: tripartite tricarboxylate transporter substrate-binding protein [Xanthobacteraceae bacterium]|nr:tripartite tricarboxylate transporter substrate-binding protein [Xanthobacteraceae bacterium]
MHRILIVALSMLAAISAARAQSVEEFYHTHAVTIVVGNSAGGGYDLNARLLARHIGKHIPGNPTVIVQNHPGAGGLNAANYIYSIAPKDGSLIGIVGRIQILEPLFSKQDFDGTKYTWIGSISSDVSTCISWRTSQVRTWGDLMTKTFTAAGQGAGADPDTYALMIKNLFGAKVKLVTGYPGTNEQTLAMERGEVDGLCGISYSTLKTRHRDWLKNKSINILVQNALEGTPDLPDVPVIVDFVKDKETMQIVKLIVSTEKMARPFMAPPGIPADRAAALRDAFMATMKDPDFIAEADHLGIEISPMTGSAIETLLKELYATPNDVVTKAAAIMSGAH